MSLKIFKQTSYKSYQHQNNDSAETADSAKTSAKPVTDPKPASLNIFLQHNKFFVLSLILLGASLVLIGHLLILLVYSQSDITLESIPEQPVVEIIKLPSYEKQTSETEAVWECADGSYLSEPGNSDSCQKIPNVELPGDGRNRFITPERVFHDE